MWRILLGCCLLAWGGTSSVQAQQWTGTATLDLSGGRQTNVYLDPILGSWDPATDPTFMALTPQLGLTRNASRTRFDATVRSRLYPRRSNVPQYAQGNVRLRYRLTPEWDVEASGGGTRYRFAAARNTWWALPALRWSPTSKTTVALRGGYTQRSIVTSQGTDRQPSGLVSLSGSGWITDRLHGHARLHWSTGRTTMVNSDFGGTGGSLRGTYWPTGTWSIAVETGLERLHYETVETTSTGGGPPGGPGPQQTTTTRHTVQDRIGRLGIETQWQVHPSVSLFARARTLVARLAEDEQPTTDVHVSGGLRLKTQQVLGGSAELPPRRRVCHETDEGIRIQIPYDGSGTPHLTGDFNEWTLPGIPLKPTEDDTWAVTLDLPSGRYAYRIRLVDTDDSTWLDLPSYAQTADDAFGGTNGVCTVQ